MKTRALVPRWLAHNALASVPRAIVLLLAVALVPVVLIGALWDLHGYRERLLDQQQDNIEAARAVAASFEAYLHDLRSQATAMGLTARHLGSDDLGEYLEANLALFPAVRDFSWLSNRGVVFASSDPHLLGRDMGSLPAVREAGARFSYRISELELSPSKNTGELEPVFFLAVFVKHDERSSGILLTTIRADLLHLRQVNLERGPDARVVLIDRLGRVAYRRPEAHMDWAARQGSEQPRSAFDAGQRGEVALEYHSNNIDGEPRLGAFVPVRSVGWVAGASRSRAAVIGPLEWHATKDFGLLVAVISLAFAAALRASRFVTDPLAALQQQAGALARGDLRLVSVQRPRELADLAQAFNAMARDIQARQAEREQLLLAEQHARRQAEDALSHIKALQRVTEAAVVSVDPDGMDTSLLDRVLEGLQADTAAVLLADGAAAELVVYAGRGRAARPRGARLPMQQAFEERIVVEGRAVRVGGEGAPAWAQELLRENDARALLGAPLVASGGVIGVIRVGRDTSREFSESDERLLVAMADRIASSIERARLASAAQAAHAEAEISRRITEMRTDLVRMVSHDLRSPLQVMLVQAQSLQHSLKKAGEMEWARGLSAIVTSGKRMGVMIGDLTESMRLESGQLHVVSQPVDLRSFLVEMLDRLGATFDVARVRLDVPEDVTPVRADPDRLERIVTNLVSNAFKYGSPDAPVIVSVLESAVGVEVSVKNRGAGIAPEVLPRLFGRFVRDPHTHTEGLGLYTTRLLVEAHGGRIWAHNDSGQGATFGFVLPKILPKEGSQAEATSRA